MQDTGKRNMVPDAEIQRLEAIAAELRAYDLLSIYAAGSGHPGGTLSILDLTTALYFRVLRHRPQEPEWPERDRVFWSGGHKAPALYVALGRAGYFLEETMLLRQLNSPMQGHPNRLELPGRALHRIARPGPALPSGAPSPPASMVRITAFSASWVTASSRRERLEAVMAAGHYQLGRLVAIIDRNGLQIDGRVCEVMNIRAWKPKHQAFGWNVISINGHDMRQCVEALDGHRGAATGSQQRSSPTPSKARASPSWMTRRAGTASPRKKEDLEKALPSCGQSSRPHRRA